MVIPDLRLVRNRIGARTKKEIVVRLCARISGSVGGSASPEPNKRPVNAARPSAAEIAQHSAAAAMNMYPRTACLWLVENLVESLWVKSDHHLFANNQCWCGAAIVFVEKVLDSLRIAADITVFERNSSLREVGLRPRAGWSARLRKENDGFYHLVIGQNC